MPVQVGADWDSKKCVVAFCDANGVERLTEVQRKPEAVERFVREHGGDVEVGIETGDGYWVVLWRNAGANVLLFDGKKVRRYGQSQGSSGASDDRRSARSLLQMLSSAPHRNAAVRELPSELRGLHQGLANQRSATRQVTRFCNQLMAALNRFHPAVMSLELAYSTLQTRWFLRTLAAAPTPAAWAELSPEARQAAVKGSSKGMRERVVEALGTDLEAVSHSEERFARTAIRNAVRFLEIAVVARRTAEEDLELATRELEQAEALRREKGIGQTIAAGLAIALTETGGAHRDGAAIMLGAAPVTRRSGISGEENPQVAMRRATDKLLQLTSSYLGKQLVTHYTWAKAAASYYRARGKSTNTIYRCLTRSFLRVLRAMQRDQKPFDEQHYIAALKAKGVPWASSLKLEPETAVTAPPS